MLFDYWMERFLDCPVYRDRHNRDSQYASTGYVTTTTPSSRINLDKKPFYNPLLDDSYQTDAYRDPRPYGSGWFSAGFHQFFPVLVQISIMRMNEVLAVENPEVHLHPSLQLKFMELFIGNALIGKFSLIETHSDLMIRRVMRAIAEEKIRQSWVNISFVRTELDHPVIMDYAFDAGEIKRGDVWTSVIEPLRVDQHGVNWPKGFLDDDDAETQALMRVLYGNRLQEEDMEENHE